MGAFGSPGSINSMRRRSTTSWSAELMTATAQPRWCAMPRRMPGFCLGRPRSRDRRRAEEVGVAEGEHAVVGADEPVAVAARGGRHPRDRLVEMQRTERTVELRGAEREDAAVGGDEPVAATIGLRG